MANYYVSKSGNDSNAGTAVGAPKLTAGSAFAAVSQGDSIIFLDSGTYSGSDNTNITARNVDDITINGSSITDAGNLTMDIGGDLTLDADGGDIILSDGGTIVGTISMNNNSGDLYIRSRVEDKDMLF